MELIFAGASHYGLGGYRSIMPYFEKIYLIQDTPKEILGIKREQDEVIEDFNSVPCPHVFLCGYVKLITQKQLDSKTYINIHGALLPKYRGMHSTFYAIMNGEKQLGITFHLVNAFMDAGDILRQYAFAYEDQTIAEINERIDALVEKYAGQTVAGFIRGEIIPQKQDDALALIGARRNLEDCLIDFHMPNELLRRFFKALTPPYPHPMLRIRGEMYEILDDVEIINRAYYGPTGRAVYKDNRGVWIKIEEGYLIVNTVRKYGSKDKLVLGQIIPIGYRFE